MNKQTNLPGNLLSPEVQATLNAGILQFLNGETIEKLKEDLHRLQDTTITECYGELDKEDKWLMVDFIRRMGNLIDLFQLVLPKPANPPSVAVS